MPADTIYLAQEARLDPMENQSQAAFWYETVGFLLDEIEAIKWASRGHTLTRKNCWAIGPNGRPSRKYRELRRLA